MNPLTQPASSLAGIGGGSGSTASKYIKNTDVTFNFSCKTQFGEQVALVGSIALLGHWDAQRAIYLTTTAESYPNWSIKIDLPRDKIIEYKYLIVKDIDKAGKGPLKKSAVIWENLPTNINRLVNTHGKKEITIYEQMGSVESIEEYVEVQGLKRF